MARGYGGGIECRQVFWPHWSARISAPAGRWSGGILGAAGGLGGAEPVGAGAGLEDVGVEGDPVDDRGDEAGPGKTVPHSSGRLVPIAIEARSSRSVMT